MCAQLVDSGEQSELLHRVYTYMAGDSGEASDLNMSLRDMRMGMKQPGQPFTVPLLRVAQFVRMAGLLPRLLSRLITQTQGECEKDLRCVPRREQVGAHVGG